MNDEASCWNLWYRDAWAPRHSKLRVIVRRDGVILQGLASTYYAKQLAQHAAWIGRMVPIVQ